MPGTKKPVKFVGISSGKPLWCCLASANSAWAPLSPASVHSFIVVHPTIDTIFLQHAAYVQWFYSYYDVLERMPKLAKEKYLDTISHVERIQSTHCQCIDVDTISGKTFCIYNFVLIYINFVRRGALISI